jgi:hypothetical protein
MTFTFIEFNNVSSVKNVKEFDTKFVTGIFNCGISAFTSNEKTFHQTTFFQRSLFP